MGSRMSAVCACVPPSILRLRRACAINSFVPTRTDPTGAHSPFERQNVAESAPATSSLTGTCSSTPHVTQWISGGTCGPGGG
jgi:hypothetical protein